MISVVYPACLTSLPSLFHAWVVIGTLDRREFHNGRIPWGRISGATSRSGGLVSCLAEELGEGHLRTVEDIPIGHLPIVKGMATGKNNGPRWARSNW